LRREHKAMICSVSSVISVITPTVTRGETMDNSQKTAAAMSAVMAYIRDQEAAAAAHNAPVTIPADVYRQLHALYRQLQQLFQ